MDHFKYVSEHWFARGTSHKETINISQLNEIFGVGLSHWTSIEDSSFISYFVAAVLSQPSSNHLDSFLSLISTCNFTGVKGPDWFISDDDLSPLSLI
jgi:hypothetical protein